jgi:DnaA family protein
MKQLVLDIVPDQTPTLDNFVTGRNAELLQALHALAAGKLQERFIYLWGEPASGKSHLLQGFVHAAAQRHSNAAYVDIAQVPDLDPDLALYQAVAVDNAAHLHGAAQIALFNLYNWMRDGERMLVVSGPCAPSQLSLRQDLVTRLGWGLVYQVHSLSDAEKMQALKAQAQGRGFTLSDEVAAYLLRHWQRDLPSLLAALDLVDRYSLQTQRAVTVPLLREILFTPQ